MTRFGTLTSLPSAVLAAILTVGGMAGAAVAQTAKVSPKPPATANEKSEKKAPSKTAAETPAGQASNSATAGLKVVKDPNTGKLRGPDRAEAAKMNGPAMNRSAEGLRPEVLPNGATVINLQGRFQSYTVATRKPGGGIAIECHTTEPNHSHAEPNGNAANAESPAAKAGNSTVNRHGK